MIEITDEFISFAHRVKLFKCKSCCSVNLKILSEYDLLKFYQEEYYSGDTGTYFRNSNLKFIRSNRKLLDFLRNHPKDKMNCIIDLGCGPGELASIFRWKRFDTTVLNVDILNKTGSDENFLFHDLNRDNYSDEIKLYESKVDIITAIDIFEHIERPERLFEFSNKFLRKKGLLLLKFPDIESLLHKLNLFLLRNSLGGTKKILGVAHLFYPSGKAFKALCKKHSYAVIDEYNSATYHGIFDESQGHLFKNSLVKKMYMLFYIMCNFLSIGNKKTIILRKEE